MKKVSLLVIWGILFFSVAAYGQQIYQWEDEKGTLHFSDDINRVPEKYRGQIQTEKVPKDAAPAAPQGPGATPAAPAVRQPGPAGSPPAKKDALGRGEVWWRDQVRQWNAKLAEAQRDQDTALSDMRAKEKELEDAKLKPDSLKRKLRAEIKALEEKVNDAKKRVQEASNMIRNELPKQAADYRADPNWLK